MGLTKKNIYSIMKFSYYNSERSRNMKITIYTITDCQFSKEEKEYLASHKLQYEEKNLETNKEFLTEMLAVSNNFAGTPVTKIEKDDGKIEVLKGFTKDEFDKALGLAPVGEPPKGEEPAKDEESTKKAEPAEPAAEPKAEAQKPIEEVQAEPVAPTPPPAPSSTPQQPAATNDPLNSILNDLQTKSTSPSNTADSTNAADVQQPSPPSVPDFPAKT